MKISFCTSCHNRCFQLEQVFQENYKIIVEHQDTEWIIVNFGSQDQTDLFIRKHLARSVARIVYVNETSRRPWHLSIAKNVAHRCATGDILCNLDCDNRIDDAVPIIRNYFSQGARILHLWSGAYPDGTCGRIATTRGLFFELGGYDESFSPMGYQDIDLLERASAMNIPIFRCSSRTHVAIRNSKDDSIRHCSKPGICWQDYDRLNRLRSAQNIRNGKLRANVEPPWDQIHAEVQRGLAS